MKNEHTLDIVLIDFGLSCLIDEEKAARKAGLSRRQVGTRRYMAPEVIAKQYYTDKVDTWAVGCMVYRILEEDGRPPFDDADKKKLSIKIITDEPSYDNLEGGEECKEFIKCCLIKNRRKRYSAAELLEHPWIS